jgi:hypothetical protein
MALIPSDAGIRMRMQTEANLLHPLAPAHEIPADLPDLQPGRTFTARIQEALPENTFKALVAGRTLTLSLPEGAKPGDQLELVVVDRSPKAIIAKQVESGTSQSGTAQPYPFARLSPAAQLIGQLLPADGESPPPAQLTRGTPLIQTTTARTLAAQLAPALARAVSQSGLFYEAHQARWVAGDLPLEQLLLEPQGQRSSPTATSLASNMAGPLPLASQQNPLQSPASSSAHISDLATAALQSAEIAEEAQGNRVQSSDGTRSPTVSPHPDTNLSQQAVPLNTGKVGAGGTADATEPSLQSRMSAPQVPEELRPIVQQQLEAIATQRLFWHGEIWPQQSIDWEIEWQHPREDSDATEAESSWRTAMSLTTPRLGRMDATLLLTPDGVRITLTTQDEVSTMSLRKDGPLLADALAAAGVPLLAFQVKQEDEHPSRQG